MNDEPLLHTPVNSVADYITALDTVCASAKHTLNIFEKNLEDIGFNSEARYDTLRHFLLASSSNHLRVLVHDPQYLVRYCPRMMMLLRQFGHSMSIYQTPPHLHEVSEPFAVADDRDYVRRYHFDNTSGLAARNDPEGARLLNSRFQEMWASSHPCASGTTLGL